MPITAGTADPQTGMAGRIWAACLAAMASLVGAASGQTAGLRELIESIATGVVNELGAYGIGGASPAWLGSRSMGPTNYSSTGSALVSTFDTPTDGKTTFYRSLVSMHRTDALGGVWTIAYVVRRASGTVTAIGSEYTEFSRTETADSAPVFAISGTDVTISLGGSVAATWTVSTVVVEA